MILRSVELESFGRFKGQTIEFRRGMNLVIGPNEAGKSTLAEAVPAVLFGTQNLERYKPWGRNACSAALFFEGGGRTIQVKRNLLTDDVELVEKDDLYHVLSQFTGKVPLRGRSAACREYRELLESLLGVGDEKLFRATYFFGHQPQEWRDEALAQNLRTLVSGTAEADYAQILDDLLDEHFSLTCKNPWGRDKQKEREYEDVCQQIANLGEAAAEEVGAAAVPVFVEIDNRANVTAQIETLAGELAADRREYEKGLRYMARVQREANSTTDATADEQRVTPEVAPGAGDLAAQLGAAGLPATPPRELPDLLDEAGRIRQEMAALQQPYSALAQREKKVPAVPWAALAVLFALCLVVVGLAWWKEFYLLWAGLAGGALALAASGWGGWRILTRKKELAACKEQRNRLDREKIAAQSRQAALSEKCEALGLPSSPIDLVRLQKLVVAHRDLLERYWAGADSDSTPAAATPAAESAGHDRAAVLSEAEAQASPELAELQTRMEAFEAGLREKELRLEALQRQLEESVETQAPAPGLQTSRSGAALLKRKQELEERITVLRQAINLLADAVETFGASHLVQLNEETGRLFGKITAGRYNEVRLDENMLPSVRVDGRRWVSADSFSRGTVDGLYLALRVALAKVRDDGRSLPLMLDDPFVHLDAKRLAKALNMVDLASADSQLILFSHNMELGKRAARERWHVVPLDGDASPTAAEEEGGDHAGQLHLL